MRESPDEITLAESELQKRMQILEEAIDRLRQMMSDDFVYTRTDARGNQVIVDAGPKEVAAVARELATILDLKRKYVRIDRGDKRQINQRIDDSLKPGGKLFLRLVQSGWTPPKPRAVQKSEGWE